LASQQTGRREIEGKLKQNGVENYWKQGALNDREIEKMM
jgi:hypothetical protein